MEGGGGCSACAVEERSERFRKCVRVKKSGAVFVELRENGALSPPKATENSHYCGAVREAEVAWVHADRG